eukprot:TRINITY_DN94737_c0_g1_i1.p1 TRINITY_DN94737_c0_g1~~TRINITY_DN94737_c0_g1_i1.p1  ORF type:complete len:375 (+),score=24.23 TRINITY_DN94737_c0_g1_i1:58-1182(+)
MFSPRRRDENEVVSPKKQPKLCRTPTALKKNLGYNRNSPRTPPKTGKESAFITSSPRSQPRKPKTPPVSRHQRMTRSPSGTMFSPTFKAPKQKNGELGLEPMNLFPVNEPLSPVQQRLQDGVRQYGHVPQEFDEYDEEEFDPYRFIASLPVPPNHLRASCLTAKFGGPRITLVLDLDETLVHCSTDEDDLPNPDFTFKVEFNGTIFNVRAKKRPGFDEFLEHVKDKFEVVVFTASQRVYADTLLDILDPNREAIKHRVFRDDCVCVEGNYLKDLTVLGRDLQTTVIVDNSPQVFSYQVDNGIPILSWFESPDDRELYKIIPFLDSLQEVDDVRPSVRNKFKLHDKITKKAKQLGPLACYPDNQYQPTRHDRLRR